MGHTQANPDCIHGSSGLESFLQFGGGGETEWEKLGVCQTAILMYFIKHLLQMFDGDRAVLHIVDVSTVLERPVIFQLSL